MKTLRIKLVAAVGIGFGAIFSALAARADVSTSDKLVATQLFKEGRALLDQGQVAAACQKLGESERIDPGGGTLLNLALCHEREGRTATAWEEFTEALGMAKRDALQQRIEFARTHIATLEPELSRLSVQVPSASDLPDLEIKRDASPLGRAAWGSAIPVDPGDHLIEVTAPGRATWKESVVLGPKADTKTIIVPLLQNAAGQDDSHTEPPSAPVGSTPSSARASSNAPGKDAGAVHVADWGASSGVQHAPGSSVPAWIAVGLGAAAAGVGTYFLIHAVSLKNDADRECPKDQCSGQGATDNNDAMKYANFATAGFAVGGLGLGLGAVLFLTRGGGSREMTAKGPEVALTAALNGLSISPSGATFAISNRW